MPVDDDMNDINKHLLRILALPGIIAGTVIGSGGEVTRDAEYAYRCWYHTAEWEPFPERGCEKFARQMVEILIRGLEGASRTVVDALIKIANHYDEAKGNLIVRPSRPLHREAESS